MSGGWIQASVSMPCTARSQSRWRTGVAVAGTGGSPARPTASTQAFQRRCTARRSSPTRSSSSLRAADADRAFAGTSVRNRDNAAVSSRIHESSRPVAAGMPCSTTARQRSRRDPTPATSLRAAGAELFDRAAPPRPWRECGPTPACRDTATRPGTVRAPAVRRRARPPLRTAGARRRAACCGG